MTKVRLDGQGEILDIIPADKIEAVRQAIEEQVLFLKETLDRAKVGAKARMRALDIHRLRLTEEYVREFRGAVDQSTKSNEKYPEEQMTLAIKGLSEKLQPLGRHPQLKEIELDDQALRLLAEFYLKRYNAPDNAHAAAVHKKTAKITRRPEKIIIRERRDAVTLGLLTSAHFLGERLTTPQILELTGYKDAEKTEDLMRRLIRNTDRHFTLGEDYILTGNEEIGWQIEKRKKEED